MVDRGEQLEGPRPVVVERQREHLGAAGRRAARIGREHRPRRGGRHRGEIHQRAVRVDVERSEDRGRIRHELERRRVLAVGAEVHQRVERAGRAREGGCRGGLVAARQSAFVDRAEETGHAARQDRNVVGDRDLEVARERDGVAVEIDRLDEAREIEERAVLAVAAGLVERIDQVEGPGAGRDVEREGEHLVPAAVRPARAAIGPGRERLDVADGRAVGRARRRRDGREVDRLIVRREAETAEPGAGRGRADKLEAVRDGGADGVMVAEVVDECRAQGAALRAVGAERDEVRERAGRDDRGAVIVARAVEIAGRARREAALVDAAAREAAGEHRHVVRDRDREVARQRDGVAVEIDALDEAREIDRRGVLAAARGLIERVDQREGPGAGGLVELERKDLVAVVAERRGGERLDAVVDRDVDVIHGLAVRRQPVATVEAREPALRRVLADELEALVDGDEAVAGADRAGLGAVGAEAHEPRQRARGRDRGAVVVAAAEQVAAVGREAAFVDRARRARAGHEHRHVVDDLHAEVVGQRDRVAVEVDTLDEARQIDGL